ncbi:MAG: hypothetical protein NTZ35_20150 [Ignavibacteriales bacterium]|nr:hypothetical protein [Ignavibacteriales bacterium]
MPTAAPPSDYSSAVLTAQFGNEKERLGAIEHIIATHWKVLYKYLRLRYEIPSSDAEAMMQSFLGEVQQKGFLEQFDGSRSPIRAFLRVKLDEFVTRKKTLGDAGFSFPLDFSMVDEELRTELRDPSQSADEYYESEWLRNIFTLAVEELYGKLQQQGKTVQFFLFLRNDLQQGERLPIEELAKELSISPDIAKAFLKETRSTYQGIVTDLIQSLTTSSAEFRKEVRLLFGNALGRS